MKANPGRIVRETTYFVALVLTAAAGQWLSLGRINLAMLLAAGLLVVVIRVVLLRSPAPPGSN